MSRTEAAERSKSVSSAAPDTESSSQPAPTGSAMMSWLKYSGELSDRGVQPESEPAALL